MGLYKYTVLDQEGTKTTGTVVAEHQKDALHKLKEKNVFVVDVIPVSEKKKRYFDKKRKGFLEIFTRQFAGLLKIGYTVDSSLEIIEENTASSSLKKVLSELTRMIRKGDSLATSLSRFSDIFPEYYTQMVYIGETSGTLDEMLETLYQYLIRRKDLLAHLRSISFYPCMVLVSGIIVVAFLMGYVIPVLADLFHEFEIPLPLITRFFFEAGIFLRSYGWYVLLFISLVIIFGILFMRHSRVKEWIEQLKLKLPLIGKIYRMLFAIQFSYLLSVLLKKGLPLSYTVTIIRNSIRNNYFKKKMQHINKQLSSGAQLVQVLRKAGIFPRGFASMISVGERGGGLDSVFMEASHFYRRELETTLDFWVKAVEPLIFLVVAFFVALIVFSILIPLLGFSFEAG